MKNRYKLYLSSFLMHFISLSFGIWLLNSFETSDSYLVNLLQTTLVISMLIAWYSVYDKIKKLKKSDLPISDEYLTKAYRKTILTDKSSKEILSELIDNYKPSKLKVKAIDDGYKVYLKTTFLGGGHIIGIKTLSKTGNIYTTEISSQVYDYFQLLYSTKDAENVEKMLTRFQKTA